MKPSHLSAGFLLSFLATVFVLQWWQQPSYPLAIWVLFGLLGLIGLFGILFKKPQAGILLFVTLGTALAFFAVSRTTHRETAHSIEAFAFEETVTIRGQIAEEPDRRPMFTRYVIEARELSAGTGTAISVTGRVLATDRRGWPLFYYGDEVEATGKLTRPGAIEDFRYDHYLSLAEIYATMPTATVTKREGNSGNRFFAALLSLKEHFEVCINRLYPEPHASLLAGLLTGSRRGIPEDLQNAFRATGLTHIIAISGFNITVILSLLGGLLFFLSLKWRFLPLAAGITVFTLFVGASASVVRAAVMGVLGLLALQSGRTANMRLMILLAATLMLLWNPKYLWYDAGFQLSFLAVLGLTECGSLLKDWLARFKIPESLGIRDALAATLAAQVFAVPWMLLLFQQLSLIAPLTNIVALPFVPIAMAIGFLSTILSIVWFPLGQIIAYIAWLFLEGIIQIATIGAAIPLASITVGRISPVIIVAYYLLLIILLSRPSKRGGSAGQN